MKTENTWAPKRYRNGGHFSRRDALPMTGVLAVCIAAWVAHDIAGMVPLPSEETMGFVGVVIGLYMGRRLRP